MTTLRDQFDELGFVAYRAFLSTHEVERLHSEIARYIRDLVPRIPPSDVFYEDRNDHSTLKQMTRMFQHCPFFSQLLECSPFANLAAELLGAAAVPKNLQYFNKPPTASTPTPPHQDGCYFMLEPNHALTMWLALDPVDESNGCVRYVPGSHKRGMRPHTGTEVLGFSQGIADYTESDLAAETPMPAEPGDLLVHHSLTIHRADANRSANSRRSLGFIYYSANAREDSEAHAAYLKALAERLERAGRL